MPQFHLKMIHHTKNQEDLKMSLKKKQPIDTQHRDDNNVKVIGQEFYSNHYKNALMNNCEDT